MTSRPAGRLPRLALLAAALGIVASATLTPQRPAWRVAPWYLPFTGAGDGADALLNVALFVPLGMALCALGARRARALAVVVAVTVAVELLQAFVVSGRYPSVGDVLTNTLGGWLGHRYARAALDALVSAAGAHRLALAYGIAWVLCTAGGALLLRPALPRQGYEQPCGRHAREVPCFPGRVLGAPTLRAADAPPREVVRRARLPLARPLALEARVVDAGWTPTSVQIAGVRARSGTGVLALQQRGRQLVFFARARGEAIGFRTPMVILDDAFGRVGDSLAVGGGVRGDARWVATGGRRVEFVPGPHDAWRLFLPWSTLAPATLVLIGTAYHLAVMVPLGYWGARARRTVAWRAAAMVVPPLAALSGAAALFGMPWPTGATMAACAVGLALGAAAGRLVDVGRAGDGAPREPSAFAA